MEIPGFTGDFFFTLEARGITPVLAHPERHPDLSGAADRIVSLVGLEIARQILTVNPQRIIASQDVEIFEIQPERKKPGIFKRLLTKLGGNS
jgi:tyrosine-protein phosphatase YwqE